LELSHARREARGCGGRAPTIGAHYSIEMSQFRNVCFTSFDCDKKYSDDRIKYLIAQKEKCPSTGKLHMQGYVEFDRPLRMGQIKSILGECHIERRKGNQQQAIKYCQKIASRAEPHYSIEMGQPGEQGARTDLEAMNEMALSGANIVDIVAEHPTSLRYVNNIVRLQSFLPPQFRVIETIHIDREEIESYCREWSGHIFHYYDGFETYQQQSVCIVWEKGNFDMDQYYFPIFEGSPLTMRTRSGSRVCFITTVVIVEFPVTTPSPVKSETSSVSIDSTWERPLLGQSYCHVDGLPSVPKKIRKEGES